MDKAHYAVRTMSAHARLILTVDKSLQEQGVKVHDRSVGVSVEMASNIAIYFQGLCPTKEKIKQSSANVFRCSKENPTEKNSTPTATIFYSPQTAGFIKSLQTRRRLSDKS